MTNIRRFTANYIFPVVGLPIRNGILGVDENGCIIEIIDQGNNIEELSSTEYHNGVIVPGFVNTHCHLELSHLRNALKKSTGIAGFVSQVRGMRNAELLDINKSIKEAVQSLKTNGIVAVGDICNTSDTIEIKEESGILFHNFIEQFGLASENANEKYNQSKELLNLFVNSTKQSSSITPHSTYSICDELWSLIRKEFTNQDIPISIHYGESKQEYILLKNHSGHLAQNFKELGIPLNLPNCESPFEVVTKYLPKESKVLFVHNTFASKEEIQKLAEHFKESFFVLCPSSNQFIEGVLPNVPMIMETGVNIAIGTDSYASSETISVYDQMMILLQEFPSISFNEVLKWATLNGAKALNFEGKVGSFEVGKCPGLNLITNFDFTQMRPTSKSKIKKLV
ncbi:MAG: amidohydrolase family protein [Tenuifilaceae bacterium]